MQKLDPHTLFSIFEKGDEEIYREHGMEDQLQNPYVLMGMVIRGLENFSLMSTMYENNFPKEFKRNKENIRRKYYTRLYSYLTRIDSNRFDNLYTIGETFEAARVEGGLQHLMFFLTISKMMEFIYAKILILVIGFLLEEVINGTEPSLNIQKIL